MKHPDNACSGPGRAVPAALIVMGALFALACPLLAGCGEREAEIAIPEERPLASSISGLSSEQSRLVEEWGYPDHFFISIDPLSGDRVETWSYFGRGVAVSFDNGRRFGEEEIADESARYPATALKPQDFGSTTTSEEAGLLLGEPLFERQPEGNLLYENTIVVYEKAVLLYRNEMLIGVDTKVVPPTLPVSPSGSL